MHHTTRPTPTRGRLLTERVVGWQSPSLTPRYTTDTYSRPFTDGAGGRVAVSVTNPTLHDTYSTFQSTLQHRMPNNTTGCPTTPQDAQQHHRMPNNTTGCPTTPQDAQ